MYKMRIAVPYEDGKVFQHFGHTQRFKVYDVADNNVQVTTVVNTDGSDHGALADLLRKGKVNVLICGGIGAGAQKGLTQAGIKWYGGVVGDADQAVEDFLQGKLIYDLNAVCDHYSHGHQDHEYSCENHTCGGNCH